MESSIEWYSWAVFVSVLVLTLRNFKIAYKGGVNGPFGYKKDLYEDKCFSYHVGFNGILLNCGSSFICVPYLFSVEAQIDKIVLTSIVLLVHSVCLFLATKYPNEF